MKCIQKCLWKLTLKDVCYFGIKVVKTLLFEKMMLKSQRAVKMSFENPSGAKEVADFQYWTQLWNVSKVNVCCKKNWRKNHVFKTVVSKVSEEDLDWPTGGFKCPCPVVVILLERSLFAVMSSCWNKERCPREGLSATARGWDKGGTYGRAGVPWPEVVGLTLTIWN